ncbi:hypothetical protein CUMW_102940 [Citrus unshiu]|nr:hypothetical protein CUMW_102940 [Citrus unshiu]
MRSLSEGCCIYRVPQETRCLNESDFTPQVISIGPLHHGKEELKEMEEHKRRYLKHFLQRTKVGIEEFLTFIKDKEAKLRSYNSENIELTSILGRAPTVGGTFKPVPQPRLEVPARTGRHRFSQQRRLPCDSNWGANPVKPLKGTPLPVEPTLC